MDPKLIADANLDNLAMQAYVGRGIIMGLHSSGKMVLQLCWTTGRSPGSRNRVYSKDANTHGRLYTEVADPNLEKGDPATTLYNAMDENALSFVVSNGHQTDSAAAQRHAPLSFALDDWQYEPDPLNTSRITGRCTMRDGAPFYEFAVQRKSLFGVSCDRLHFDYQIIAPGLGRCLTTYMHDGSPPRAWHGEPYLMPLQGPVDVILNTYWDALSFDNRVSCAVKAIPLNGDPSMILSVNKNEKKVAVA